MNLDPLFDAVVTLVGAVIVACVPIVTLKVTSWLGVTLDSEHRDALNSAIATAIGKALQFGQEAGDSALANVTIKNSAVAAAVSYVNINAADAVEHFGLSNAAIAEKVAAKLALALHETGDAPVPDASKAAQTASMLAKVVHEPPVTPAIPEGVVA